MSHDHTRNHQAERDVMEPADEDLFAYAKKRARFTDPPTSRAAAAGSRENAKAQRRMIMVYLSREGPHTADEIDAAIGWRPTTAGRRTGELARNGRIVDSGVTRRTRSGRRAVVWAAV